MWILILYLNMVHSTGERYYPSHRIVAVTQERCEKMLVKFNKDPHVAYAVCVQQ